MRSAYGRSAAAIATGSVSTAVSNATFPSSPTTQIAVSSTETSRPVKYSITRLLRFRLTGARVAPLASAAQGFSSGAAAVLVGSNAKSSPNTAALLKSSSPTAFLTQDPSPSTAEIDQLRT